MSAKTLVGIVLAAGESARMGSPKQLLPFRGTTLLNYVVATGGDVAARCRGGRHRGATAQRSSHSFRPEPGDRGPQPRLSAGQHVIAGGRRRRSARCRRRVAGDGRHARGRHRADRPFRRHLGTRNSRGRPLRHTATGSLTRSAVGCRAERRAARDSSSPRRCGGSSSPNPPKCVRRVPIDRPGRPMSTRPRTTKRCSGKDGQR